MCVRRQSELVKKEKVQQSHSLEWIEKKSKNEFGTIFFWKNGPSPASFLFLFVLINKITIFTTNLSENGHLLHGAGIWTHNLQNMKVSSHDHVTSGQSYKASTNVNYDSRVVPDLKIPLITTLESYFTIVEAL